MEKKTPVNGNNNNNNNSNNNNNVNDTNKNRNYNTPVSISKLHIRLLDKYGDVIDINRNNYSLLLELTIKTN